MQVITTENRRNNSFLMQKFVPESNDIKSDNDEIDKIKILELSNFIDLWEQELLFGSKGFFSFKGKETENKSKEFISELSDLINSKIDETIFLKESSKIIANKIKNNKLNAIFSKMTAYEQNEINNWQLEVCDDAVNSAISRAVLYKNDEDTVITSFKNGLSVLELMSEKEDWDDRLKKQKEDTFKSQFFSSLIEAYIKDKDINARKYYEKYKKIIPSEKAEEIEQATENLKIEIISYNWAKEVFSYNLSDLEQEKELNKIKDSKIKKRAEEYLKDFSRAEKKNNEQLEKEKNEKNWQEIIKIAEEDINKSALYIDYTLSKNHISSVNKYIKQIKEKGYIKTDIRSFLSLFCEFIKDFNEYKNKDISSYRACLSDEDFEIFNTRFMSLKPAEYLFIKSDYEYLLGKFTKIEGLSIDDKYSLTKLLLFSFDEYKTEKNKKPDIQERRKILDMLPEQFMHTKKEGDVK